MKHKFHKLISSFLLLVVIFTALAPIAKGSEAEPSPIQGPLISSVQSAESSLPCAVIPILYGIWSADITPDYTDIHLIYKLTPEGYQFFNNQKTTSTSSPDTIISNFNYSPTEQITLISYGNNATTTNSYDATHLYRLSNKTSTSASSTVQSLAYAYDSNGNITQIADSSSTHTAKTVNYAYDDLNRLTSASSTSATYGGDYLQTYTYDAIGNILNKSDIGNYTYASSTTSGYANPDSVVSISGNSYAYDNNGNLTSSGTSTPLSYTWDYNNRLLSVVIPASEPGSSTTTVTSSYDPSGQRLSYATALGTSTPLTTYYPSKNYNIDSLGNSTKHIFANGMMVATITVIPHLITGNDPACTPPSSGDWTVSTSCTFTGTAYAPESITVNAGKLLTLAAGSKLLMDFKHYKLLVKHTGGVLIKHTATLRQYKASDIGTSIYYQMDGYLTGQGVTTNSDGAVVELMDYYPYGTARLDEKTGTLTEQRKYIGQEYDASTGLNYLNARYYNSSIGRFYSQDPQFIVVGFDLSNPQSLNSYSYGNNNPITISDPTGLCSQFCMTVGGGFISGGDWVTAHPWTPAAIGAAPLVIYGGVAAGASAAAMSVYSTIAAGAAYAGNGIYNTGLSVFNWAMGNPQLVTNSSIGAASGALSKIVSNSETGQKSSVFTYGLNAFGGGLSYRAGESRGAIANTGILSIGTSVLSDVFDNKAIDWGGAILNGGVSAVTTAITKQVSGVRGSQAQSYSSALTSARTQQSLQLESFSFSMGVLSESVRNSIGNSVSSFAKSAWNWIRGK